MMSASPERTGTVERPAGPLAAAGVQKLYMPTALLKEQLPSGIGTLGRVPRLGDYSGGSNSEQMQHFVAAIRKTARVFESSTHTTSTQASYDKYICWISASCELSGFSKHFEIDTKVRAACVVRKRR